MIKHEAKFGTKMVKWLKYNRHLFEQSILFEHKVVRPGSKSFPFSELSDKEKMLLYLAKNKCIIQTHSDLDRMGTNCGGSIISGGGWIFLHWVEKGNKEFFAIDIEDIMEEMRTSTRKSLTLERARAIGQSYLLGQVY